ncbi:MAG: hypothetical protein U0269_33515 [Polyangiales bacterium]
MASTHSHEDCRCIRCGFRGPARRAPLAAKLGRAAVWVMAVVMMVGVALTGFGAVVLGPLTLAICAFTYAPLAEAADQPDRCERCNAVLPPAVAALSDDRPTHALPA